MDNAGLLVVSLLVLAFGLISKRVERSIVTPPMAFVAFGIIVGAPTLGIVRLEVDDGAVRVFTELALVLVLFVDASRIDLAVLRREYRFPLRLLTIGMPLTIALGAAAALVLFPVLSFFEAALLAAILAPTDAALGQAVVSDQRVPVRIRQALNVESGLNDGIALPVVLALAACAEAAARHNMIPWVSIALEELTLGPVVGVAVGYLGARAVGWASGAQWMNQRYEQLAGLALAVLAFTGAEQVGGNGFIAAFVAGLTLGNTSRSVSTHLIDFAEIEGQLLVLVTFFLVGLTLVWPAGEYWNWQVALYAGLSLTIVRMLTVALCLKGMGLRPLTTLFLGWFGPRGLASILFSVIIVGRAGIPHRGLIIAIVMATALASIFAHGLTASPAARWYGRRLKEVDPNAEMLEHVAVTDLPVRASHRAD